MDFATECRVIASAVSEMRKQGVPRTPANVTLAVNACRKKPNKALSEMLATMDRQLDAALTAVQKVVPQAPTLTALAEQTVKDHPDVLLHVDEERGTVHAYLEPATNDPGGHGYDAVEVGQPIPMSDFRRNQLQQQLDASQRIADDPQSSLMARKSAALAVKKLRKLLGTTPQGPTPPKGTGEQRPGYGGVEVR